MVLVDPRAEGKQTRPPLFLETSLSIFFEDENNSSVGQTMNQLIIVYNVAIADCGAEAAEQLQPSFVTDASSTHLCAVNDNSESLRTQNWRVHTRGAWMGPHALETLDCNTSSSLSGKQQYCDHYLTCRNSLCLFDPLHKEA